MRSGWVAGVAVLVIVVGLPGCAVNPVPAGSSPTPGASESPSSVETVAPVTAKPRIAQVLVDEPDMVYQRPEQVLLAPSTFAVDGTRVVVADSLNWVFAVYDGSKRVASIPRPPGSSTIDLEIRGDLWYLLSRDNEVGVYRLAANGRRLLHQETLKFVPSQGTSSDSDRVYSLGADGDDLFAVSWDGACMPIKGECAPDFQVEERDAKEFLIRDGQLSVTVRLKENLGSVQRVSGGKGDRYFEVNTINDGNTDGHRYVYHFSSNGGLIDTYSIPTAEDDLPKRDLVVADGKVYLMLNTTKTAKILLIAPNP